MNSKTHDTRHSTPKILIVDDDLIIRELMYDLLTPKGYSVDCVQSGRRALDMMSQQAYELIISDMIMDEMSGIELLKQVKEKDPDIPFLVMTGHASMESAIQALRLGAFDYMKKPVENNEILITIKNALEVVRLRQERAALLNEIKQHNIDLERKIRERTEDIKRAKDELEKTEKKYRSLVENSPDIIYILDSEGCFSFVDGALESLLGFTAHELIGKHFTSIIYPEDISKAKSHFNERRTGERSTKGFEIRLKTKKMKKVDVEVDCLPIELHAFGIYDMPVSSKDKTYQGTYGVARDITKRKQIEDELLAKSVGLVNAQRIARLGNWDWDIVNNKLQWSDEIYRIFGLSFQEFENTYESFLNFVHPDDRQFVKTSVDQSLQEKSPYNIDHRIILSTGEERIVHVQGEVELDGSGKAIRMIGTVQDITENKKTQEKLKKSQTMLQTVFDGISEPLIMLDSKMKIQMFNVATRKYYGLAKSKNYTGVYCFTAGKGISRMCDGCDIQSIIKNRDMRIFERKGSMNSSRIEEVAVFPISTEAQAHCSLIRISDITDKKKIQDQLIRADRLSSLGQLSAGIAHEIRNPLAGIRLFLDIICDEKRFHRTDEEIKIINEIRDNVDKIDEIIKRVLDFTKPIAKAKAAIDINELILEEIKLWSSKIRKKETDVKLSLKKDLPPIFGDSVELRQVLNNLIMNSLESMGKKETININTVMGMSSFHKDRKVVIIKVKDSGPGIKHEHMDKIFDPFFTTKTDGTGLGLSLCNQIIGRNGGVIFCDSQPGKGTTFTIEIPCMSK